MGSCLPCIPTRTTPLGISLPPGVLHVTSESDSNEATVVAARSFAGTAKTDPEFTLDWILGPHLREKWDDPRRQDVLGWIMRMIMHKSKKRGGIVLGARNPDGALAAVCITFPYLNGKQPDSECLEKCHTMWGVFFGGLGIPPFEKPPMNKDIGAAIGKRLKCLKILRDLHETHAHADHWYVCVMAVDPDAQGSGYCGKLMRTVSAMADQRGVKCYLETSSRKNVAIYERFGYKLTDQRTVSVPDDPDNSAPYTDLFAMVRPCGH